MTGYAARFEGLSADTLFEVEDSRREPDDAREYVEQLLVVLADWRRVLIEQGAGETAEYTRCLNTVREAWLQYSFRWVGGPELPYPFDLPQAQLTDSGWGVA